MTNTVLQSEAEGRSWVRKIFQKKKKKCTFEGEFDKLRKKALKSSRKSKHFKEEMKTDSTASCTSVHVYLHPYTQSMPRNVERVALRWNCLC